MSDDDWKLATPPEYSEEPTVEDDGTITFEPPFRVHRYRDESPMSARRLDQLMLVLVDSGGTVLMRTILPIDHPVATIDGVHCQVQFRTPGRGDGPFAGIDEGRLLGVKLMPWRDVEDVAEYVRGDGSDPQRVALSDGILSGRQAVRRDAAFMGRAFEVKK